MIKDLADLEPRGLTPLAAATNRITAKIVPMAPALMMKNQRVCVVIATDGTPTDNGFQEALGRLQALPVWVVVRLCTDEDSVIDYYNDLDAAMEAPMEVLDDLLGEAHEVCKLNRWCATARPPTRLTSDSNSPMTPPHVALLPRHTLLPTHSPALPRTHLHMHRHIHPHLPQTLSPPACALSQADVRTADANRSRKSALSNRLHRVYSPS